MPEGEVSRLLTETELKSLESKIEGWLSSSLRENPLLAGFERDSDEPAAINRPARFSDSPKVLRISGVELTKIELCKRPTAVTENTRTFDGSDIAPRLEFTCLLYLVHQIWKQNRFSEGI